LAIPPEHILGGGGGLDEAAIAPERAPAEEAERRTRQGALRTCRRQEN
jgi:hypothetical protein